VSAKVSWRNEFQASLSIRQRAPANPIPAEVASTSEPADIDADDISGKRILINAHVGKASPEGLLGGRRLAVRNLDPIIVAIIHSRDSPAYLKRAQSSPECAIA
jgi:hypothetical protein